MPRPSAPASPRSRAQSRLARLAPLAPVVLTLIALALLPLVGPGGCEREPELPVWDNPFDPLGPDGGDPLRLRAVINGNQISLSWLQPQGMDIDEYVISRADGPDLPWSGLALVPHTTAIDNVYLYSSPEPARSHWFRIQAIDARGRTSLVAYATPARVELGPRVILNAGGATITSRVVTVKVLASQGTALRVALGPTYGDETTYPAAAAGDTTFIVLDIGAADQGDTLRVRVIATGDGFTSAASIARARVDFSPDFGLLGGGTVASSRTVTLTVPPAGVSQMRFASSEAGLAAASWVPGAATYTGLLLSEEVGPQDIWGEFIGDFGFNATTQITVTPGSLQAATFRLVVPQNHVTDTVDIRGILTGKASLVRWSESNLAAAPWLSFTETLDITLSPESGLKTIYLQMRNDWGDSPTLTDYAVLVSRGVEVAFMAPQDGDTLQAGVSLQVRGTAFGGGAALDSVKADLGDGLGFRDVTGLATWSHLWSVPAVEADSLFTLRARAWAGTDSATVVAEVLVEPVVVAP